MTVEKVNGKINVTYGNNQTEKPAKSEKTPEQIKDGKKKLALTLGALAAAGAVIARVVVAVKKGKINKLSVEDFKKVGKFDKGKALIGDKGYTGEIFTKDGTKILYENGLLKSAENHKKSLAENFRKTYSYLENGDKKIFDYKISDDVLKKATTIKPDKRVIIDNFVDTDRILSTGKNGIVTATEFKPVAKDGKKFFQKIESVFVKNSGFKNGEPVNYKRITDLSTSKVSLERINSQAEESLIKVPVKLADGRKGKAFYNGKEILNKTVGTYDPATNTVIKEHLYPNSNTRSISIFDKNKNLPTWLNIHKDTGEVFAGKYLKEWDGTDILIKDANDLKELANWPQNLQEALKNYMKKYV